MFSKPKCKTRPIGGHTASVAGCHFQRNGKKIKKEQFGREERESSKSEANAALFLGVVPFSNAVCTPSSAKRGCTEVLLLCRAHLPLHHDLNNARAGM